MERIKKNDTVMVVSGKYRGKIGKVIEIWPKKGKVLVKDVAIVTRHIKAKKRNDVPGIRKEESPIALSKVMPICPVTNKPCRVASKMVDGKKVRISIRSKELF